MDALGAESKWLLVGVRILSAEQRSICISTVDAAAAAATEMQESGDVLRGRVLAC